MTHSSPPYVFRIKPDDTFRIPGQGRVEERDEPAGEHLVFICGRVGASPHRPTGGSDIWTVTCRDPKIERDFKTWLPPELRERLISGQTFDDL